MEKLPVGMPVAYNVPPGHWLWFGDASTLAGLVTASNADGTHDLVVFPRHRPSEHLAGLTVGFGPDQFALTGQQAPAAEAADPAPADPAPAAAATTGTAQVAGAEHPAA